VVKAYSNMGKLIMDMEILVFNLKGLYDDLCYIF